MKKEWNPCWHPKEREREIAGRIVDHAHPNSPRTDHPMSKAGFLPNSFCPADWLYPLWSWLFHFRPRVQEFHSSRPSHAHLSRRPTHESQTLAVSAADSDGRQVRMFDSKLRNDPFGAGTAWTNKKTRRNCTAPQPLCRQKLLFLTMFTITNDAKVSSPKHHPAITHPATLVARSLSTRAPCSLAPPPAVLPLRWAASGAAAWPMVWRRRDATAKNRERDTVAL